jgi:tetratricopeptide (TPR) repeat protein
MGNPEKAIRFLQSALERHPFDRNILYILVTLNMENGKPDRAREYAEKLVEYYPEDQNYRQLMNILQEP